MSATNNYLLKLAMLCVRGFSICGELASDALSNRHSIANLIHRFDEDIDVHKRLDDFDVCF